MAEPIHGLAGKSVLITGAASGLGAALARSLAAAGADIAVADIRQHHAEAVAGSLREAGARAHAIGLDVGDPGSAKRAVRETLDAFGRLDVLVNNAGTDVTLPIDELGADDWLRVINTNLNGPFLLSKFAATHMRRAAGQAGGGQGGGGGGGHIVNVCSTAAKRAWPNASAYHASKWGLLGLSHALHAELRQYGIKVTAVVAGGMRTPFLLERFPGLDPASLQDPAHVAEAIKAVLLLPESVVAEITVLPLQESSWP
ncbi:KR domain-containing protein [Massilia glaciei]|uniref:KR domain-containing protein n=2 Tax=Massilia glaciei TaxID=1524097 RepID=A0A2U2HEX5_9BURK|nr:KR domain-containing protein [Massilia glaciei]